METEKNPINQNDIVNLRLDVYSTQSVEDFLNSPSVGGYAPLTAEDKRIKPISRTYLKKPENKAETNENKKGRITNSDLADMLIDLESSCTVEEFLKSRSVGGYVPLEVEAVREAQTLKLVEESATRHPCPGNINHIYQADKKDVRGALMTIIYHNGYNNGHLRSTHGLDVITLNDIQAYENHIHDAKMSDYLKSHDMEFIDSLKHSYSSMKSIIINTNPSVKDVPEAKYMDTLQGINPVADDQNSFLICGTDYAALRRIIEFSKQNSNSKELPN